MTEQEITLEKELTSEENISLEVEEVIKEVHYPELENLEVTPTKELQFFTHDDSYGYDNVQINSIPDEYIIPNGTLDVSENGNVDVTNFKMARVGVYTPPNLQDKSITITKNGTTNISAEEGYDGLSNVDVTVNVASSGGSSIPKRQYFLPQHGVTNLSNPPSYLSGTYTNRANHNAPSVFLKPDTTYKISGGNSGYYYGLTEYTEEAYYKMLNGEVLDSTIDWAAEHGWQQVGYTFTTSEKGYVVWCNCKKGIAGSASVVLSEACPVYIEEVE